MTAAGKMNVEEKLFDPEYSGTIAKYVIEVADEVSDIVDKKYIDFFQAHPTKEDFGADTIISEIINDERLSQYF